MIAVGFTGTRKGLTPVQRETLEVVLINESNGRPAELHHGDCLGADATAHDIATSHGWRRVVHPPNEYRWRAFKKGDLMHPEKPYLERDRDIVAACSVLVACPKEYERSRGGGTWYTFWHAVAEGRDVVVVYPDGRVERGVA